ncbi:hypothetical protein ACFV6F_11830 [Kitasatospora phosalacinea]|uniref:hypothetical protein n=1 Tax=Kitasatospora phosalacinea TaxID=2065 RepID=UPI003665731F
MDTDNLEYWHRHRTGLNPPELVERLLECGHAAVVAEQAAGPGSGGARGRGTVSWPGRVRLEEAHSGVLAAYAATTC